MKQLLGIDVGTSGVKCLLIEENGTIVASATATYPLSTPRPTWSEQDPHHWWEGTLAALRELFSQHDASQVAAVGLCGQMHGLVAIDSAGEVVRNAILWNDQRTEGECAEIINLAGGLEALVSCTNNTMLPGYTGGKLLWLKKNEPEAYAKTEKFVLPKDYIRYQLTGKLATDVSDASGTGLFDVKENRWAEGLMELLDLEADLLPEVVESDEASGTVSEEAASVTGLKAGIPVYGGGGDAVLQNAGMGIVSEGTLGVILGTSGVVATPMRSFADNENGRLQFFRSNEAGSYMVFGCQLSCAGAMEWFRQTIFADSADPFPIINREAAASPIGSGGVCFLPYLSGERCPHPDPNARGVFYGLSLATDRGDLARALMEGVTFGLYEIYGLMQQANPDLKVRDIIISGGGSKSPVWKQIIADIFGLPVKVLSGASEGGAYGAALVAAVGEKVMTSLAETEHLHEVEETVMPDEKAHEAYRRPYELFRRLYEDLKETYMQFA